MAVDVVWVDVGEMWAAEVATYSRQDLLAFTCESTDDQIVLFISDIRSFRCPYELNSVFKTFKVSLKCLFYIKYTI